MSHIFSNCEDMQYLWVILDSFEQASEVKHPKLVTKNTRMFQKLSLLAVHLRQSLTLTMLKGLKVKTKFFIQLRCVKAWFAKVLEILNLRI